MGLQSDITVTFASWATNNYPYTQSPDLENAPAGTVINAIVSNTEFSKYVTMLEGSSASLTDVTYEGVTFADTVDASGNYSIKVPSTGMGLAIRIYPSDVATNLTYSVKQYNPSDSTFQTNSTNFNYILASKSVRYIFTSGSSSITAFTGNNIIEDLSYNDPKVTDPLYFGSSTY